MKLTESKVRDVIQNPFDYSDWTVQGLGMLRVDFGSERIHFWDPNMALNQVVSAHDHPWDMNAKVVVGRQGNQRFTLQSAESAGGLAVQVSRVVCGIGSHLEGNTDTGQLVHAGELELYGPDESYYMRTDELHDSFPERGTVTVIDRLYRDDPEPATICWAGGGDWRQEGFTRAATREDIQHYVGLAVMRMKLA